MNRILGLDYGERRIGVAISDPLGIIASPFLVIDRKITPDYLSELKHIIQIKDVNKLIVGLPLNLKGEDTKQTEKVKNFITELSLELELPVNTVDERLSSVSAEKELQKMGVKTGHEKGRVDETAAAIILQEYLDSK